MVEHGYVVVRQCQSPIVWPNFWQPVHPDSLPARARLVWCFVPYIGNDDDGYGYVMLGKRALMTDDWTDEHGMVLYPVFWAKVFEPEPPIAWPTLEETKAKAETARRNVVERTGPFAQS